MILQSLADLARREGLLQNPDYEPRLVAWIIAVGNDGQYLGLIPTVSERGPKGKPQARKLYIPRRTGRASAAVADFMVDKSEYVLGVEPDGKRGLEELNARRALFRQAVESAFESTRTEALSAVAGFLKNDEQRLLCIAELERMGYKSNDLFAFQHGGRFVHDLPEVQDYFSRSRRQSTSPVQCLICGRSSPPVDKHPGIKVPGGTTSGVALVSFNKHAFESFGLSRNENAPVCRDCADAYTTALTRCLDANYPDPRAPGATLPRRSIRLSPDTVAVYWAEEESEIVDLFAGLSDAPDPESVAALFKSAYTGRAPAPASARFFCLILSGAQGRAILRGMHTGTVAEVEENIRAYFRSIDIGLEKPLPLFLLLRSLAVLGKSDNLAPNLAGDLFLAIVFGRHFSRTLLAAAVQRCRAEQKVTRERAAILRAYMIRNERMEVTVSLDNENVRPGYRLGRLLAVLERLQQDAVNPSKTIVERYYGAASTRPATVFPSLIRLAQHHAAKMKSPSYHQSRLGEVLAGIASFPPVLGLDEQGLFALGYYHQRQDFYKKRESAQPDAMPSGTEPKGEQE